MTRMNPENWPDYKRPEVVKVAPKLTLVHDLLGGTETMHARASAYIRKWSEEKKHVYDLRSTCEPVYEATGRTLDAAIGLLYQQPPRVEWGQAEATLEPLWGNIDGSGNSGVVFAKRFSEAALADGLGALLTDGTAAPVDSDGNPITVNSANQDTLGVRPKWAGYPRAAIHSWRTAKVAGGEKLTQVVFRESLETEDGEFGVKMSARYRRVRLIGGVASWEIWDETGDAKAPFWRTAGGLFKNTRGQPLVGRLPVRIAYTGRSDGIMDATVPLAGVAYLNLAHWRKSTDICFYEMICAHPQPTVIGQIEGKEVQADGSEKPKTFKAGPLVLVQIKEGGDFRWTELTGTAIDRLEKSLERKERQMAALGAAFLASETRAAETAEAKRLDSAAQNATLATAAQGLDDCFNGGLEDLSWFMGLDRSQTPTFELSRQFENTRMSPAEMREWVAALLAGAPLHLFLKAWQTGGHINQDEDLEEVEMLWGSTAVAEEDAAAALEKLDAA